MVPTSGGGSHTLETPLVLKWRGTQRTEHA